MNVPERYVWGGGVLDPRAICPIFFEIDPQFFHCVVQKDIRCVSATLYDIDLGFKGQRFESRSFWKSKRDYLANGDIRGTQYHYHQIGSHIYLCISPNSRTDNKKNQTIDKILKHNNDDR